MLKVAAWAVLAAAVLGGAVALLQKAQQQPEPPVPAPGGRVFPIAASVAEGVQRWSCPADPSKWFPGGAKAEVIDTAARWQEYLDVSGFESPLRVDFARSRVALIPFIGGGGLSLVDVLASPGEGAIDVVVKARDAYGPNDPRPQDIRYECRLVVLPRDAGRVVLKVETERPAPKPRLRRR
ncbi:MAG: hypothetical protein HY553_07045 [Elusimicrobia bacterium]|nr:hypothetical protein [Elusimicrobiota bacterium]